MQCETSDYAGLSWISATQRIMRSWHTALNTYSKFIDRQDAL